MYKGKGLDAPKFDKAAPYIDKSERWLRDNDDLDRSGRSRSKRGDLFKAYEGDYSDLKQTLVIAHPRYGAEDNQWRIQAARYWASKVLQNQYIRDQDREWVELVQSALKALNNEDGTGLHYAAVSQTLKKFDSSTSSLNGVKAMRHYWRWQALINGHQASAEPLRDISRDASSYYGFLSDDQYERIQKEIQNIEQAGSSNSGDQDARTCEAFYNVRCGELLDDIGEKAIIDAVRTAPVAVVEELIKEGADVHAKTEDGATLLHLAAFQRDSEKARVLIDAGAPIDGEYGRHGWTPLHHAVMPPELSMPGTVASSHNLGPPDEELVQILLDAGAWVEKKDQWGRTPIVMAGDESIIKTLVRHGARVSETARGDDETVLFRVVRAELLEAMQSLVEAGASPYRLVDVKDDDYPFKVMSPASLVAFHKKDRNLLEKLLEFGMEVEGSGANRFIRRAIKMEAVDVLQTMLDHGLELSEMMFPGGSLSSKTPASTGNALHMAAWQ